MNPLLFYPLLLALVYRAHRGNRLTPLGILSAIVTACAHGIHPWNFPFLLLIAFYTLGTAATKVKHDVKAHLTICSTGAPGGEGARSGTQVFANSLVASVLTMVHAWYMKKDGEKCFGTDVLWMGKANVCSNYAAVTADTLSSELGILSRSGPRMITTFRRCAPGTNGGVSITGLIAGAGGSAVIGLVSGLLLPFCDGWSLVEKVWFVVFITGVGLFGSVLDSLLGAVSQETVVDVRTGKVVEAPGGGKVLVQPNTKVQTVRGELRSRFGKAPGTAGEAVGEVGSGEKVGKEAEKEEEGSRKVVAGLGVLSNNGVNFVMAAVTSGVAMGVAEWWWRRGM
ncbi:DUF92 domain protein [Wilcoxina mikolae CBS 423.85]|nr:DUF92 domain protein [Wilcoxina mikolae CBS 423.85]